MSRSRQLETSEVDQPGLAREAALEWLHQLRERALVPGLQAGSSLHWVRTTRQDPAAPELSVAHDEEGLAFTGRSQVSRLPESLSALLQRDDGRGPDLAEAMELLFTSIQFLIEGRGHLLDPLSPAPALLRFLVERMGIDGTVHRWDARRLISIVAALPGWLPQRGSIEAATALLEALLEAPLADHIQSGTSPAPSVPEVLVSRPLDWYVHRLDPDAPAGGAVMVRDGVVQMSPELSARFPLTREDVRVSVDQAAEFLLPLLRLAPAWVSLRLQLGDDGSDGRTG